LHDLVIAVEFAALWGGLWGLFMVSADWLDRVYKEKRGRE
jgi:hypothetical protein